MPAEPPPPPPLFATSSPSRDRLQPHSEDHPPLGLLRFLLGRSLHPQTIRVELARVRGFAAECRDLAADEGGRVVPAAGRRPPEVSQGKGAGDEAGDSDEFTAEALKVNFFAAASTF